MQQQAQFQFAILRIYVKDLSIELPAAPEIFRQSQNYQVGVHFHIEDKKFDDGTYEVMLRVTVEGKKDEKTGFIVEVKQAGHFRIQDAPPELMTQILRVFCPGNLFPYARQSIDQALIMASLPPLMLAPVNFEALLQKPQQSPVQ